MHVGGAYYDQTEEVIKKLLAEEEPKQGRLALMSKNSAD